MKKYKIGIWGQSGGGGKIADGQAVRTAVITKELEYRYGKNEILFADTHNWRSRPFAFFMECVALMKASDNVLILPADNGFRVFVPILMALNKIYRKRLAYIVIGGFLPELLKKKPVYVKLVNKFDVIFVQTDNLKKDLEHLGISNIHILSNLKRLNTRKGKDLEINRAKNVKVCTFSRINKEKGIEDAIKAVKITNASLGENVVKLDLYGMIPEEYEERFNELLMENSSFIEYKGIVDYDKTVETLKEYFALLFPTFYYGEGFPGNVVDAYNTGLPIIATDWLYNSDVIKNGINGILVPINRPDELSKALLNLYNDREYAYSIALNNLHAAKDYHPDKVLRELYEFLDY